MMYAPSGNLAGDPVWAGGGSNPHPAVDCMQPVVCYLRPGGQFGGSLVGNANGPGTWTCAASNDPLHTAHAETLQPASWVASGEPNFAPAAHPATSSPGHFELQHGLHVGWQAAPNVSVPNQQQWQPRAAPHDLNFTPMAKEAALGPVQLELQRGGQAAPIASLPACSSQMQRRPRAASHDPKIFAPELCTTFTCAL